ncbi:MAG: hypothetical protein KAS07_01860 [Candidatus Pacebacteria bacterium]|nr:hypothetical protein [Candidatus Paceibacterota bacterium]
MDTSLIIISVLALFTLALLFGNAAYNFWKIKKLEKGLPEDKKIEIEKIERRENNFQKMTFSVFAGVRFGFGFAIGVFLATLFFWLILGAVFTTFLRQIVNGVL